MTVPAHHLEFVAANRLCVLSWNRGEGASDAPPLTPVFYVTDGDDVLVSITEHRAKTRALRRDAAISVCVLGEEMPFPYVTLFGTASIDTDPTNAFELMARVVERMGRSLDQDGRTALESVRRSRAPGRAPRHRPTIRVEPPAARMNELPAGDFLSWLGDTDAALRGERDADVPCGGCTACCRSFQFVHVGRDEAEALAHIPKELLFPAPHMPDHLVMGYDERGHCPMLSDGGCTIYAHRPRACRMYDCRVVAATGVTLEDDDKAAIAERVARWRFSYPTAEDVTAQDDLRRAAADLASTVRSDVERAVIAVRIELKRRLPRA